MSYPKGLRKVVAKKDLQKIKREVEEINKFLLPEEAESRLAKIVDIVDYYLNK